MQVDLLKELEAPVIDQVDVVVDLPVVRDLVVDDGGILDDALVVQLRVVDAGVLQVTVKVVEFV